MRGLGKDRWIDGWVDKWKTIIPLSNNPFILRSLCFLGVAALVGCAGYKLGPTNGLTAGDKAIQITPFLNHTLEPRLGDAVTAAVRKNIQRDATYHLATHGGADIIVTGVLTHYVRHELSFEPHDVLTVRDYRISVTAQITARDVSTGNTTNWTST